MTRSFAVLAALLSLALVPAAQAGVPDVEVPDVAITSPADLARVAGVVDVTATAEDESGIAFVQFYLGDTELTPEGDDTAPYTASFDAAAFPEGTYTLKAVAEDNAGNTNEDAIVVIIDRTGPELTVSFPAQGSTINIANLNVGWGVDEEADVSCTLKGVTYAEPCANIPIAEGAAQLSVRAEDLAGNVTTVVRSFTVDRNAPDVTITSGPEEGETFRANAVTVSYGWAIQDLTTTTARCRLDSGPFVPCATRTSHTFAGVRVGEHEFTLRVADAAGNAFTTRRHFRVVRPAVTPPPGGDDDFGALRLRVSKRKFKAPGRLRARVNAPGPGRLRLELRRKGRMRVAREIPTEGGRRVIRLRLKSWLRPGRYVLRLRFTPQGGGEARTKRLRVRIRKG